MSNYTFTLNMIPNTGTPVVVNLSQGDIGRELTFKLVEGSDPNITIATDASAITIEGTKPSGLGFSETCTATSGNTITVSTTEAMTQESGMIPAEVRFVAGTKDLGTANIIFAVEASPHPAGTTDGTTEEARTVLEQAQAAAEAAAESAEDAAEAAASVGDKYSAPIPASTASIMTDHDKVYLYTGDETGCEYGNWYYWNGTAWTSGGAYGTGVEVYVDGTSLVINTNVQDGNEVSY